MLNRSILAAALVALCGGAALAQSTTEGADQSAAAPQGLEEIVVTAQKRSENLQNVPIAVSVVSGTSLTQSGVTDLVDLKLAIPALNLVNSNGYLTSTLRGVGSNAVGAGFESPVALYVDNVYYASPTASILSLNNVAQVEVLKGPQGTLFGRNATAGLTQVTTRDPSQNPGIEASIGYANYETSTVNLYLGGNLAPVLAADIAAEYTRQNEGWGHSFANGDDVYQMTHNVSVRSKWILSPVGGTRVTLIGDYAETDTSNPLATIPGTINGFLPALGPTPDRGYNVDTNFDAYNHLRNMGVSVRWDQDIAGLQFASTTAYRRSSLSYGLDYDATSESLEYITILQADRQFSEELQLSSKSSGPLTWVLGAYYFHATTGWEPFRLYANDLGVDLTVPNSQRTESTAGYAQATYAIAEQTNLTLGGRYTTESRTAYDGSTTAYVIPLGISQTTVAPNEHVSFDKFTYRVSLDHRFTDQFFAYLSANRGFKSGGFNVGQPGTPAYLPETLDAYEVGTKSDLFDRRLRINAAAFYYDYKNMQVQELQRGQIIVINGASAHIYGLDLDFEAKPLSALLLTGGLSYSKPDFKSFPGCLINTPEGGAPSIIGSCAGKQLPLSTKVSANLAAEYVIPVFDGSISVGANAYFNDGFFTESDNAFRQPSYVEFGALVRWSSAGNHFSVSGFGKNLSDRRVISYETTIPNGTHTGFFEAPRTYGVSVSYKY